MTTMQQTLDAALAAAVAIHLPLVELVAGENDRTRFDDRDLTELAASMAEHGLAQPITVRPRSSGGYEIVAGERRTRAARQLGWASIPAIVRELSDEAAAGIMLAENILRRDLDPLDEAGAYQKRMQRFGWSAAETARQANVSVDRVRRRLALLSLLPDVQKLVRSGQLPIGHAELLSDLDSNRQLVALRVFTGGRAPTLAEFRRICGELAAQQSQAALIDLEAFYAERLAELEGPTAGQRRTLVPRDPNLPKIAIRRTGGEAATVGQAILAYADQLRAHGLDAEALTVSTMLDDLLDSYWTTI